MVEDCPHCGLTVLFGADGRCPHCRVDRDAPVTEQDLARADQIRADLQARPVAAARDAQASTTADWVLLVLGGIAILVGVVLTLASFGGEAAKLYYGSIAGGAIMAVRAVVRLGRRPPPDA
ncbi:MAG: hypothetical protein H6738_14370 [Alphaproteobacteria bacterium]|nr:hypothetical protein [Alphaproteobacteria bacterium]MCB9697960.1 hypothetical protein [Alphaproteobacteria bacterium]